MAVQRGPCAGIEQVDAGACATGLRAGTNPESTAIPPEPAAPPPRAGDFILTHGDEWTSKLIRFGQGLRYRGASAKYTYWNHTAIFIDDAGTVVEALGPGVAARSIRDYDPTQYTVVRINASDEDRAETAAFARWAIGAEYGWVTIVSLALSLVTGGKLAFAIDGQLICSGLVARALERTTAIFKHDPARIMPAELAEVFKVEPPAPGTPKGHPPGPKRS
ncbi:MAG TPA: hypothetical protein VM052_00305 [Candidatus Limnocylindrales bacterium]|nr:hypothetical protein [Candidatus Limnocylindrales bacterium]